MSVMWTREKVEQEARELLNVAATMTDPKLLMCSACKRVAGPRPGLSGYGDLPPKCYCDCDD